MKNKITLLIGSIMVLTIAISPLATFAKDKGHDNNGKNGDNENSSHVEKKDKKENGQGNKDNKDNENEDGNNQNNNDNNDRGCFKAFGHLFAPGWIKHNGETDWNVECHLPFGIGKKFHGNNASSTATTTVSNDVTAPIISNVTFPRIAQKGVEVRWSTDERSDSTVFWSTTTPVDTNTALNRTNANNRRVTNHQIVIRNLTASTTYYVVVRSRDAAGNTATSSTYSFTTKSPDTTDVVLPVISGVVTLSGTSTVQLGWKTNEVTSGRVFYSTNLPVALNASTTSFIDSATTTKDQVVTISGLATSTTYYVVIEATDLAGNVSTSPTFAVTTHSVADITAPVISAVNTTNSSSTVAVSWVTNENSNSKVYYSTVNPVNTSASTTSSVSDASLLTNHSLNVSGLATSTLYYFVVQSTDSSNNTATSTQFSTTTLAL